MKNSLKIMLVVLMMCLLAACSKPNDNGDDNGGDPVPTTVDNLVGTYSFTGVSGGLYLTTNSAQTSYDPNAAGTGSIAITGDYTASLKYMMIMGGFMFQIENAPPMSGSGSYPAYSLTIIDMSPLGVMMGLTVDVDDTTSIDFTTTGGTFSYDSTSLTVTLTGATMAEDGGTKTVTVDGSLQAKAVNIPANTSTLTMSAVLGGMPEEMTFNADMTYTEIDDQGDTTTGTWALSGDTLNIYDPDGDTIEVVVSLTTKTISATMSSDFIAEMAEDTTEAAAKAQIEMMFLLDAGSLTAATTIQTYTMTRKSGAVKAAPVPLADEPTTADIIAAMKAARAKMQAMKQ